MPSRLAAACLIALALLAAAGARADEHDDAPKATADAGQPTTTPTRDVDITYRLTAAAGAAAAEQRVRWQVATGRQRIDPPTPGLHIIVDARTHRLASVRDAERLALEIDAAGIEPMGGGAAHYLRRGDDSVAGIACAVWQADGAKAAPLLCFTGDGVLLRVAAAGRIVIEAVHVTYAPSDPADFDIPADYRRIVRAQAAPAPAPAPAPQETRP